MLNGLASLALNCSCFFNWKELDFSMEEKIFFFTFNVPWKRKLCFDCSPFEHALQEVLLNTRSISSSWVVSCGFCRSWFSPPSSITALSIVTRRPPVSRLNFSARSAKWFLVPLILINHLTVGGYAWKTDRRVLASCRENSTNAKASWKQRACYYCSLLLSDGEAR